ncbi:MAG: sigma-70 family RNA polymerase sigma factor [Planctomycetales bacterium]|nr:sigma-70 family RNA polymerase sigma factor [Planctomycetales bacterium]
MKIVDAHNNSTSHTLIGRAQNGEQEAWSELIRLYSPVIVLWCHRRCGLSMHDTEDVAQEVIMQLLVSLERFDHRSFRGFLWTITRSKFLDWKRRKQGHATGGSTAMQVLGQVEDPNWDSEEYVDAEFTESEQQLVLRRRLKELEKSLPADAWDAVQGRWINGEEFEEIASRQGKSRNAVEKQLSRLRKKLEGELLGLVKLR